MNVMYKDFAVKMEKMIRDKISDRTADTLNCVYTLGINVRYDEMIKLMDARRDGDFDNPVFIVTGSDEIEEPVGFVFYGQDGELMFFGTLGNEPTKTPHPLEDIAGLNDYQTWCVGIIEFDRKETETDQCREDFISSLLRAFLVSGRTRVC